MPEQLSFFDLPEHVVFEALAEPEDPAAPVSWVPTDPRQCSIFDGPLSQVIALQTHCSQLDVAAARAQWALLSSRFPDWTRAERWPEWIDALEALLELAPIEARAERLAAEAVSGGSLLPGLPAELRRDILDALRVRTATDLLATRGALAEFSEGKPAAHLFLLAGRLDRALEALAMRISERPRDARSRGYYAEALWRSGRQYEALGHYRDAYLVDPEAVDEAATSCTSIHDLLDEAAELELPGNPATWVGLLGELRSSWPQTPPSVTPANGTAAWQVASDALLRFRVQQRAGHATEHERMTCKRALLRCAPQLGELVRRL
jgi:tetratricopeptide (TPR) repeat protein